MPEYALCRICLLEDHDIDNMQPLFDEGDLECEDLVRKIEDVGGIRLRPFADIPNMLCYRCMEALNISYKFREMCQTSENAFERDSLETIVKTELKTELVDGTTLHEDCEDGLIFDMQAEYIDGEEIEMVNVADAVVADVLNDEALLDETHLQFDEIGAPDNDNDCMVSTQSSDSDYKPIEKPRNRAKTRKSKHAKRGRPRLHKTVIKLERGEDTTSNARTRRSDEETPSSIMCEICGNIYTKRGALNMHMRRHMAEKPFACEICGKRFAGPSELNRHIRVHTGEKPFTCKYCSRTFGDRSSNIRHERTHTNERPFSCPTCGKAFSYSNVLKNHMLTHTGEKPFICIPCNKTFSRKHQLDQHLATITHQATAKTRAICEGNTDIAIECIE